MILIRVVFHAAWTDLPWQYRMPHMLLSSACSADVFVKSTEHPYLLSLLFFDLLLFKFCVVLFGCKAFAAIQNRAVRACAVLAIPNQDSNFFLHVCAVSFQTGSVQVATTAST